MSTFFWDAFERILKTFVQAFLAQTTAAGLGIATIADTSMLERGLVAGLRGRAVTADELAVAVGVERHQERLGDPRQDRRPRLTP